MSRKLTLTDVLDEVVPALSAAGLSNDEIRQLGVKTQARMGDGGTTREWVMAMGVVIAEGGNERAMRAYQLALDVLLGPRH